MEIKRWPKCAKSLFLFLLLLSSGTVWAQSEGSGADGSQLVLVAVIALVIALVFAVVVVTADNLIRIKGKQVGIDDEEENLSIFPAATEIFRPKAPSYVNGSGIVTLSKGYDIKLEGKVEDADVQEVRVNSFAVQPTDYLGIAPIPKVVVEVGDEVKAGDPLFFNKKTPEIKYVAPVSGEVVAINRGAKRAITEVVILADKEEMRYRTFEPLDLEKSDRQELVKYLVDSGVWPLIRQRPFNVVADIDTVPKSIFVSTFSTAPLAPDMNVVVKGREQAFQQGLDVLAKLSGGPVFLGLDARNERPPAAAFTEARGVQKRWFRGPHPAGNVGVQIHYLDPINAGDTVWTLDVQAVITVGQLLLEGKYDASRVVGLVGTEFEKPKYVRTLIGAKIGDLVEGQLKGEKVRLVSGDPLSGDAKTKDQFLGAFHDQLTTLEEGDYYEMFGWLVPQKARPSMSRTYPNFLFPGLQFKADTNTHGEQRAFVMTGRYDSVVPMDIYPQQLLKSILVQDFEQMEGLGIYEVVEEDLALCEFVCTSKQPVQQILRDGLDLMREQS